ncbi:MAG: LAGLIDADG family homing endonuclease [Candidatus Paceibacterota bacterium]
MGSRSSEQEAYIAGFLDGDGSLMLQIKKRHDRASAFRFMATICLYQDTRHEQTLLWMRKIFGIGYLSRRNDGMSELRINGYAQVLRILLMLKPYVRFKRVQIEALIEACGILLSAPPRKLESKQLIRLVDLVLIIQNENYATKRKRSKEELFVQLGLTP